MKKGFVFLIALLAVCMALPALAQSTGVTVDGKTYVITGGDGTYSVGTMIFVLEGDEIIVQREGEEDLHLRLEATVEDEVAVSGTAAGSVTVYSVTEGKAGDAVGVVTYTFSDETETAQVDVTLPGTIETSESITCVYVDGGDEPDPAVYSAYAKYGLSYDAAEGVLYYQGARVRIFEDSYELEGGNMATLAAYDGDGEVDVRALRDDMGELTGIEALSAEDFAARDLQPWQEPSVTRVEMTATDGTELPIEERVAFFAPFAEFGLRYDAENDLLFYQEKQVRRFVDIRKSNGEALEGGGFVGELTQLIYEGGTVDVTTIRDYEDVDAAGEGKLLGLAAVEVK